MGGLMRLRLLLLGSLLLGGCAAATAVSAVPTVLGEAAAYFNGQDVSLALDMKHSLVAVQQGLDRMSLHVDVLEPVADGYAIEFGNGELNGDIHLLRQTQELTTVTIKAHRGMSHETSVETAMIEAVRSAAEQEAQDASFDFSGYDCIYAKPEVSKEKLGWFRSGAALHVSTYSKAGWLKITLPSGKNAYIKGTLQDGGV
jgi:hypothetical protein